jgi:uncharacterized protein (TIGR03790 family)
VALLVNAGNPDSITIAGHYAALRDIPVENVISLQLENQDEMPMKAFLSRIYVPVKEQLKQRGLSDHIAAWVYSAGFPYRITTENTAPLSLNGATLTGGTVPAAEAVKKGTWSSPYFLGPEPGGRAEGSMSFMNFRRADGSLPAVPSMMLGYTGPRGNTVREIVSVIRRGVAADATDPHGTVLFITSEDVRSSCRDWQFEPVRRILEQKGIRARILDAVPEKQKGIIGLMMGAMYVFPRKIGSYSPGCMAEHLTSCAGMFESQHHTKISAWLKAGATASCGTVSEPYALWTKFPNAIFFVRCADGCSLMESFYQAVRSPLQLLMIGEPLCAPWSQKMLLTLVGLEEGPVSGTAHFYADLLNVHGVRPRVAYFLDGQRLPVKPEKSLQLDTTTMADGWHVLRVTAAWGENVRSHTFAKKGFEVNNQGRRVTLSCLQENAVNPTNHALKLNIDVEGEQLRAVEIRQFDRLLETVTEIGKNRSAVIELDASRLGFGPVVLHAWAEYADDMKVKSPPLIIDRAVP